MMEKKIFYGEYTLMHWIEMLQRGNIVLPEYQRRFVWNKEQVNHFVLSLKQGNFIPPVIIGAYNDKNLIIDGQQRLSSLLLSYLGRMPKPDAFRITDAPYYVDMDEGALLADDAEEAIAWTIKIIVKPGEKNSKADILRRIDENAHEKYDVLPIDCCLDEAFLNRNYLGFSYIVPGNTANNEQVKFYSTVFHDINMQGEPLRAQESRRSLYYLDSELVPFFEPSVARVLKVTQNGRTTQYDFVRSLAFTSQYAKNSNADTIAKKCRRQEAFEQYYADFINAVINDDDSQMFGRFSLMVGKANIQGRMDKFREIVTALDYNGVFRTIIEADTKLIGLIYYVIILGKSLDATRYVDLTNALDAKISEYDGDEGHKRSPNSVTYLRRRIRGSIEVYGDFLHA